MNEWRHYAPSKHWDLLTPMHSVTSQKTRFLDRFCLPSLQPLISSSLLLVQLSMLYRVTGDLLQPQNLSWGLQQCDLRDHRETEPISMSCHLVGGWLPQAEHSPEQLWLGSFGRVQQVLDDTLEWHQVAEEWLVSTPEPSDLLQNTQKF